jgi:hypothetical protein
MSYRDDMGYGPEYVEVDHGVLLVLSDGKICLDLMRDGFPISPAAEGLRWELSDDFVVVKLIEGLEVKRKELRDANRRKRRERIAMLEKEAAELRWEEDVE